jgi:rhomboid protease GluP
LLIDASVLVFIAMVGTGVHVLSPTGEDLLAWGANYRPYTLDGQWWRLLTCCFVHIGAFHLLLNMYALLMIGLHLEPLLGRWRMFALYGITGVFASLTSLWWHDNTVSAGASGAIFGLYGVFLALLFTDLFHKDVRQNLLQSIGIFVVYNLINGLKGGVDNAAHIGGLVSGLAMGGGLYFTLRKPDVPVVHLAAWSGPLLALGICSGMVLRSIPMDDAVFQKELAAFQVLEQQGIAPFNMPDDATANAQLILVQDSGLPAWREAVALLHRTDALDLSPEMARQRTLFTVYAEARLHNMELVEAALMKGDAEPDPEMQASFARIDSILSVINGE